MLNLVSFGTENCEKSLDFLYKHLIKNCEENFVLHYYSINYKSNISGNNLIKYEIYPNKNYKNPVYYKPMVLLKSLIDSNSENFIYLDLDILLTKNFSSDFLFNKINKSNTPMSPSHFWEYPFEFKNDIKRTKGEEISKINFIERCGVYVQNCLIIYNKKHFQFLLDWNGLIHDNNSFNLSSDDEELYNVMLWKYKQSNNLGYICVTDGTVNVNNMGRFNSIFAAYEKFQKDEFEKTMLTDENNYYKNFNKKNVMVFHGFKLY